MIHIDENFPDGALDPSFPSRDVTIKRGINAKEVYEIISEIGRGKFGTVYKCQEKATGLKLAAKFVPIPKREDRRSVEREVEIMNSLQHHLIIQLYAAYEYQKMMCVVLELVEGGELFDRVIDDEFILTERVCTVFIRQVCEAMQFIHRNSILHLDLKPENILCLTKTGNRIKIIDFGLARKYDPDKKLQILFGTPEFVAPEVVNFDNISFGTDMWSVGVICYVLLSGLSPFMGETDIETMANVTIAKYDFDDEAFSNVSTEALDFITKLLVKDISARMSASECLEHSWLERRPRATYISPPESHPTPMIPLHHPVSSQISPIDVPLPSTPISPQPPTIVASTEVQVRMSTPPADPLTPPIQATPAPICTTTPATPPRENTPDSKELETTKDNLKNFIERWETHPNSPYIFDNEANLIVPVRHSRSDSVISSRACSPSPCESLCSTLDDFNNIKEEINEPLDKQTANDTKKNADALADRQFKDYLQSFDRRNSDTNYILGRRPSGEKVNLAEEIRKLSDHLLMLSEINIKLRNGQEGEDDEPQEGTTQSAEQKSVPLPTHVEEPEPEQEAEPEPSNEEKPESPVIMNGRVESPITVTENGTSTSSMSSRVSSPQPAATPPVTPPVAPQRNSIVRTEIKIPIQPVVTQMETSQTATVTVARPSFRESTPLSPSISATSSKPGLTSGFVRSQSVFDDRRFSSSTPSTPSTPTTPLSNGSYSTRSSSVIRTHQPEATTSKLGPKYPITNSGSLSSRVNSLTGRFQGSFDDPLKPISNGIVRSPSDQETARKEFPQTHMAFGVPWPVNKRTKFRINQLSRDVPVGSPNTHQAFNLEDAANTTKDCLLHLLEKYNHTRLKHGAGGRHLSISVDRNISDNLEYRSMSSINAFFQRHSCTGNHIKQLQAQLQSKTRP